MGRSVEYQRSDVMTIDARLDLESGSIELQRLDLPAEIDSDLPAIEEYRIDFSVTSRMPDARMSFQDRWPAHRFEALGKVFVVPPGEAARARSGAGKQEAVICHLRKSILEEWVNGDLPCSGENLDAGLDIRSVTIARLMTQMGNEVRTPGFASAALCEALSIQVAVELSRFYLERDDGATGALLPRWRLALIDDRLVNSRMPPSLSELAALCGVSPRHLTRTFRASRGCSIGAYIRDHQVELAKRALAGGESVKALAHSLGFSSRSSFSHAFRKATGLAPQQFRQCEHVASRRQIN
jgi:AraC family transcriptional regulator